MYLFKLPSDKKFNNLFFSLLHFLLLQCSSSTPPASGTMTTMLAAIFIVVMVRCSYAFAPTSSINAIRDTSLSMAPRFDKSTERWITDDPAEMAGASYGPIGSLYRAGPKPFFTRIFNPDTYDQGNYVLNMLVSY